MVVVLVEAHKHAPAACGLFQQTLLGLLKRAVRKTGKHGAGCSSARLLLASDRDIADQMRIRSFAFDLAMGDEFL